MAAVTPLGTRYKPPGTHVKKNIKTDVNIPQNIPLLNHKPNNKSLYYLWDRFRVV